MIVKINGNQVAVQQNEDAKPAYERNAMEERETGSVVIISDREQRYETYDKVDVTTPNEQYLVQGDVVAELNGEWEHSLELIENIAYFDTIYPADRSFRKLNQTLEEILTVYKRELETYHDVLITFDTLDTATLNEIIPYKEFTGLNFSQILQSLFRKIWAIPKVTRVNNTWDIYPQYHSTKNTAFASESTTKSYQQNNTDYGTRVKSQLKNAVNENGAKWFPSETGYILPRSSTYEKTPSKMRYELDSPILAIETVEVIGITLDVQNINTSTVTTYSNQTIDITDYVQQNEIVDLKPATNSTTTAVIVETDNAKTYVRYDVGQPYITNLYESNTDTIFFVSVATNFLENAIWRAFYTNNSIDPTIERANNFVFPTTVEDIKLRVKYIGQRDMDIIHSRKTKGEMNNSTTIHQQRDASVETGQYLRNLKFYSNRMGNLTFSKSKVFDIGNEHEVFDYTTTGIVTRVRNTYLSTTKVYCEWEESENFANIQAEYALMKRSDPYSITTKSVTTNLIYEEYLQFSFSPIASSANNKLTTDAKRLALAQFESATNALEPLAVGVFKPDLVSWDSNHSIHMPVEISGNGNNISMHVYFDHQNIAAKTYYDLDNATLQDYLNPLAYTDSDGRLQDFYLYFTPAILFEDTGEYPLILDETSYLANKYTDNTIKEPLDLDANASFAYTFTLSLIADDEIFIGDKLAKDNYLFNSQSGTTPSIYSSTKPYGQFDQKPRSYDTNITASVAYTYNSSTHITTITPSLAIDYFSIVKDGEILLAVNKSVASGETLTIYVNHFNKFDILFIIATATGLSNLTGTASLVYTSRIYQLTASATNLSSFTGSASLAYTTRLYDLTASATGLSNFTGSASIIYTSRLFELEATANGLSNFTGTAELTYTSRSYELTASATGLSNLVGTANLTYTSQSYNLTATASGIANFRGTALLDVPDPLVEWVAVSSGTVTGGTCIFESDLGNIKSEDIETCSFVNDGPSYQSSTDLSQSQPSCNSNASYTICFPNGDGTYTCQDRVGEISTVTQKYECVYK